MPEWFLNKHLGIELQDSEKSALEEFLHSLLKIPLSSLRSLSTVIIIHVIL